MLRKGLSFFLLVVFVISLSGCATIGRKKNLEIQGLRNQVSVLEAQLQAKDQEIETLKDTLTRTKEEAAAGAPKKKVISEIKRRPSIKHIQAALKNAGYYSGPVDGHIGKKTKDAIKAFQKDNNLVADGRAGRQTWDLLRKYLYKKVK